MSHFLTEYKDPAFKAYKWIVIGAAIIGALEGLRKWVTWRHHRKYIAIKYKPIEPIVNITCDVGKLGFNLITAGGASAVVCATAPVSVPILLYVCEDSPENQSSQNEKK